MAEKRYAILIASSEYSEESGLRRLRCPENDVRAVDEILCSPDFGQFTETFVFRNAPSYEILPRLNSVLTDAGKDDLVLIYFSGHGKLNRLGHLCLATANTDSKALEATSIRASTIKSYFDLSYSRKKILLLDCCYSGAAGEEFARTKGGVDEELQLMSGGQGTFIMTASSGIQTSVEKESDQYGLFTKHLVQGIRSGEADKNEDGQVDMQELYEYVHEKVREEGAQEPMKWGLHVKGKLVVSQSGKQSRQEMEQELYCLAAEGLLTRRIVHEAIDTLHLFSKGLKDTDRQRLTLINQLIAKKVGPPDFIEQWMRIVDPKKSRFPLLVVVLSLLCIGTVGGVLFLKQGGVQEVPESPIEPAQETFSPEPVMQDDPPEQTSIPDKTDVTQEQEQVVEGQSATILVSLPVDSLPKEEPVQPFIIIDHPRKKKVVVNTEQAHTEDTLEQPVVSQPHQEKSPTELVTNGMELASDPKVLQGQKNRTIGRYIDHGNGTITDTKTGLMWKRCSEGLSGENCEKGEIEKYTADDVVKRFKNVEYADYSDWRLPTIDELETLVYCSKGKDKYGLCNDGSEKPTINQQAFPNTASWYRSGSNGMCVILNDDLGDIYYGAVLLVRSGQ